MKVRGSAADGDLLVPSGEADGTAVAVDPGEWDTGRPVIGQAWEATAEEGVSEVTTTVGIDDPAVAGRAVNTLRDRVDTLEAENDRLRARLATVEDHLGLGAGGQPTPADD